MGGRVREGQGKTPTGRVVKRHYLVIGTRAVRICKNSWPSGVGKREFVISHSEERRLDMIVKWAELRIIVCI